MNAKTTLALLVVTGLVAGGYLWWQGTPGRQPSGTAGNGNANASTAGVTAGANRLTQPPLGDEDRITRVTYQRRGKPLMVFERAAHGADPDAWVMSSPVECAATSWMVNDVIMLTKGLTYVSTSPLGTAADEALSAAGLLPTPRARVTLTRDDGTDVTVHFGKTILPGPHTYVYLPQDPTRARQAYLTSEDLEAVLERPVAAYRDRRVLPFEADHARVLHISESDAGQAREYELRGSTADHWRFEAPLQAAADDERIHEVLRALSRLWVREWLEQPPVDLAALGLDPPRLSVRVTTAAGPASAGAAPLGFDLSSRHPLQAGDVLYIRRHGEGQVGLVNAAVLRTLTPDMVSWRDLRLLAFEPQEVRKVSIGRPDGRLDLRRDGDAWVLDPDGNAADADTVADLLTALAGLRAVSYVDDDADSPTSLETSAAVITLHLDQDRSAVLRVGLFTEDTGQRLRYVQVDSSGALAKVRSRDVQGLFGDLQAFRDRTVLVCNPAHISRLELQHRVAGMAERQTRVFELGQDHLWHLVEPLHRQVLHERMNPLIADLANLRAERVLSAGDDAAMGLDDPDIRVVLEVSAIPVVRPDGVEQAAPAPQAARPQRFELHVARRDDRVFARRLDQATCYELPSAFFARLTADLVEGTFWSFDPQRVQAFTWTTPAGRLAFERRDGRWEFAAERDLPLDGAKVQAYLAQVRDIRTQRFVTFESTDLASFGLDQPLTRLRVDMGGNQVDELLVSEQGPPGDRRRYATIADSGTVFLLAPGVVQRAAVELADFETE